MKTLAAGVAVVMALAGCASAPESDPGPTMAEVAAGTSNTAGQDGHQMTGSRLQRSSTDRMLKAVGAQGARDEMRNAPRPGAQVQ
jgi:Spy/CpxP family protein refolding chaperone